MFDYQRYRRLERWRECNEREDKCVGYQPSSFASCSKGNRGLVLTDQCLVEKKVEQELSGSSRKQPNLY